MKKDTPLSPPADNGFRESEDAQHVEPQASREDIWFEKYRTQSYKDLAMRMRELNLQIKAKDDEAKALKAEFDVIRLRVVPERFAEDDITNMKINGVGRLAISSDAYCNIRSGRQEELLQFLRDQDMGDVIKEGVNPSTLKSLVKEMYKEHLESAGELDLAAEAESAVDDFFDQQSDSEDADDFQRISEFVDFTPFMKASITKA